MVKDIDIKEAIFDKYSEFNVKRFKIGNIKVDRPTKTIDGKNITKKVFEEFKGEITNPILETSKLVKKQSVDKVLHTIDDERIKGMFEFKDWMSKYPFIISLTFQFNPYKSFNYIKDISGFFEYYYELSNPLLLIPNIKTTKTDPETGKKETMICLDDYTKFIDEVYQILNYKNKKPVFVPVSLKLGMNDIKKLARYYLKKEYFNIWFDFEGGAITKPKIARIRSFLREFEDNERISDVVVYSTNIKREIISNIKSERSPASDVLTSLTGSNLVGINREPQRPIEPPPVSSEEELQELKKHKARLFDPSSYYYLRGDMVEEDIAVKLLDKNHNVLLNSRLLDEEFKSQTNHFLENMALKDYILTKPMVREYKEGKLIEDLFPTRTPKITEWF